MSYQATNWAYELALRAPAKPVLVALADMADESHSCYPSQERLAFMTGFDARTVRRAIGVLEQAGLVRRERRHNAYGHRTSDRFILAIATALQVTEPTGQSDQWSESPRLPVRESSPSGHSDLGTIREPSENQQQARHEFEPNARTAIESIRRDRSLPLTVEELLSHAYRLGDGDPWAGYLCISQITATAIIGAQNPAAVLRKRLKDAA